MPNFSGSWKPPADKVGLHARKAFFARSQRYRFIRQRAPGAGCDSLSAFKGMRISQVQTLAFWSILTIDWKWLLQAKSRSGRLSVRSSFSLVGATSYSV